MPIFKEFEKNNGMLQLGWIIPYVSWGGNSINDLIKDYHERGIDKEEYIIRELSEKTRLYIQAKRLWDTRGLYSRNPIIFCTEEYLKRKEIVPSQGEDSYWNLPVLDKISFKDANSSGIHQNIYVLDEKLVIENS